jgi:hypothetical protein
MRLIDIEGTANSERYLKELLPSFLKSLQIKNFNVNSSDSFTAAYTQGH